MSFLGTATYWSLLHAWKNKLKTVTSSRFKRSDFKIFNSSETSLREKRKTNSQEFSADLFIGCRVFGYNNLMGHIYRQSSNYLHDLNFLMLTKVWRWTDKQHAHFCRVLVKCFTKQITQTDLRKMWGEGVSSAVRQDLAHLIQQQCVWNCKFTLVTLW